MLALGISLLESPFMFGAFEMKYKYSNLYKVEVSGCVSVTRGILECWLD